MLVLAVPGQYISTIHAVRPLFRTGKALLNNDVVSLSGSVRPPLSIILFKGEVVLWNEQQHWPGRG